MKKLMLVLIFLGLTVPLAAQWTYSKTAAEKTVSSTAVALFVAADVNGEGHPAAMQATCSLSGANIRVSWSSTVPTTSLGQVLTPGQYIITGNEVLTNLFGIRDDSTDATWNCILQGK